MMRPPQLLVVASMNRPDDSPLTTRVANARTSSRDA